MSAQGHLSHITKPTNECRLTRRPGYGLEVWWRLESLARVASQPDEMDASCVAFSRLGGGLIAGPVLRLGGVLPRIASGRGRGRTGGGSINCCTTTPRRAQAGELVTGGRWSQFDSVQLTAPNSCTRALKDAELWGSPKVSEAAREWNGRRRVGDGGTVCSAIGLRQGEETGDGEMG